VDGEFLDQGQRAVAQFTKLPEEGDRAESGGGDSVEFVMAGCEYGSAECLRQNDGEAIGERNAAMNGFDACGGLPELID
jgi:hypothetical protein